MRKKIRKMDCIEYLSVQAPLEKVRKQITKDLFVIRKVQRCIL